MWHGTCGSLLASGLAAGLVLGMVPQAAVAQSAPSAATVAQTNDRLNRIETQMRALQRAVFPGGDQRFFEPEISADAAQAGTPVPVTSTVSSSALSDVLARIEAIEAQLTRLTAASEVSGNAISTLQARIDALEARAAAAPAVAAAPATATGSPATAAPATATPAPAGTTSAAARPTELVPNPQITTPAAGPTPERLAAVQAILKPSTDDAGDDEYVYGFRLWDAGFYPEAQQQLSLFLERYPTHSRVTFARNLLGRAYLDAGEPRRAATHFFDNYRANPNAARAPDSLLFLAESMIQLGDTNRACLALSEFGETYPALATGRLAQQLTATRARVTCP